MALLAGEEKRYAGDQKVNSNSTEVERNCVIHEAITSITGTITTPKSIFTIRMLHHHHQHHNMF